MTHFSCNLAPMSWAHVLLNKKLPKKIEEYINYIIFSFFQSFIFYKYFCFYIRKNTPDLLLLFPSKDVFSLLHFVILILDIFETLYCFLKKSKRTTKNIHVYTPKTEHLVNNTFHLQIFLKFVCVK